MNKATKGWRWARRFGQAVAGLIAILLVAVLAVVIPAYTELGRGAAGARLARMEASPQWKNGRFVNPEPLANDLWATLKGAFTASSHRTPAQPLPIVTGGYQRFATAPASGLRVTWMGHSSLLVEIDGHRVLVDPIWSDRASPLGWVGPQRWYDPPVPLDRLPAIDAVVISHDHYDHLDYATLVAMRGWDVKFVVPLGLGAHLAYWGIPESRIVELDWWDRVEVGKLTIVSTPARHASGRTLLDNDAKLWSGYALIGPAHRAYYSGDTGLFPAVREIGARLGPFDLTMIEVGQYDGAWPDWHIGPEQAVLAHRLVRGRVMLPVHWGLFNLAYHGWTEPIERVLVAAARAGVTVIAPKPGESVEPRAPPPVERWWPKVPWKTADQTPVVSTKTGSLSL
jgi:L-ascorbate metabolism protein UlaG (beta-lactamase superfamily)